MRETEFCVMELKKGATVPLWVDNNHIIVKKKKEG